MVSTSSAAWLPSRVRLYSEPSGRSASLVNGIVIVISLSLSLFLSLSLSLYISLSIYIYIYIHTYTHNAISIIMNNTYNYH